MLTAGEKKIVNILMRRDDLTEEEAIETVKDCLDEVNAAIEMGDFDEVEDIVADYLGLEPDYIVDLLI